MLDTDQVAAELRVSVDVVRRWARAGYLPPAEPKPEKLSRPRALKFTRAAVEAFKAAPPPPRKPRARKAPQPAPPA